MNKVFFLLFLTLIFSYQKANALNIESYIYKDAQSEKCNFESMVQRDIMICVSQGYLEADEKLNKVYKHVLRFSSLNRRSKIVASERAWLLSKAKECDNVYESEKGGQEALISFISCHQVMTESRIKYFEKILLDKMQK